jgi:large subunit ribosomal protein L4
MKMAEVEVFNSGGQPSGKAKLPETVFEAEPNMDAVYHAVRAYSANQRRGTASAKTRADVSGSGSKPWRQKGTGRARAGTAKSPLWPGGGVVFGPKPRCYSYSIPKKEKRLAARSALGLKATDDKVRLLEDLTFEYPKTRKMAELLNNLGIGGHKTLLLVGSYDENLFLAGRNIRGLSIIKSSQVNAYQVLEAEYLLITKSGLGRLEEVLSG